MCPLDTGNQRLSFWRRKRMRRRRGRRESEEEGVLNWKKIIN
jgi:hypothetical protein